MARLCLDGDSEHGAIDKEVCESVQSITQFRYCNKDYMMAPKVQLMTGSYFSLFGPHQCSVTQFRPSLNDILRYQGIIFKYMKGMELHNTQKDHGEVPDM